jgi:hypothetical protein
MKNFTLTNRQKQDFGTVFHNHSIKTNDAAMDFFFSKIEEAITHYKLLHEATPVGKTEITKEITRLQNVLRKMSPAAMDTLSDCAMTSRTHQRIEESKLFQPLMERLYENWDMEEPCIMSVFSIATNIFSESCEIALKDGGKSINAHAKKAGRPTKWDDVKMVATLASAYELATRKRATESPGGVFDNLLHVVFNIVKPGHEHCDFRKLIRKALNRK